MFIFNYTDRVETSSAEDVCSRLVASEALQCDLIHDFSYFFLLPKLHVVAMWPDLQDSSFLPTTHTPIHTAKTVTGLSLSTLTTSFPWLSSGKKAATVSIVFVKKKGPNAKC